MNKDKYYMNLALKEAEKGYSKGEVPVGVVMVLNDTIIATGYNLKEEKNNVLNHAELIAIKEASDKLGDWRLEDIVMYVTLFPCPMCASAIVQSRIKKVVVGAPTMDSKIKQVGELIFEGNNTSPKVELIEHVLEKDCKNILSKFFQKQRNNKSC